MNNYKKLSLKIDSLNKQLKTKQDNYKKHQKLTFNTCTCFIRWIKSGCDLVTSIDSDNWSVTVFKCKSEEAKDVLINFYGFVEGLQGVKDLHFLIRDRVNDEIVFSFCFLREQKEKEIINSKVSFKLRSLIPEDNFVIDPDPENSIYKYVTYPWREAINERGSEKFTALCNFLGRLSRIVVDMAKEDCFDSEERVEIVHLMSCMLGCTEYGRLSTKEMQVGYYDRIGDKYHTYLKQDF